MKEGGRLLYRCRACGKVCDDWGVPDVSMAMITILLYGHTPKEWGVTCRSIDVHHCDEANMGIADLIGGRRDP
jgi:uncharacterized Zn finger protein